MKRFEIDKDAPEKRAQRAHSVCRPMGAQTAARRLLRAVALLLHICVAVLALAGCHQLGQSLSVRPRTLADVPAERLAFRFEPDVDASGLPATFHSDEPEEPLAAIKSDFEARRPEEALLRTVVSPDGQRALALYGTSETAEGDFRLDLYSSQGLFIRNILPRELVGTLPQSVAWSPDGQQVVFVGIKNPTPQPTPQPPDDLLLPPEGVAQMPVTPTPSVAPIIAPVSVFNTEQIYVCDRDGYNIRPLTTRDGLIYFQPVWAPDGHAVAAVACKPQEWDARRAEDKLPAGRPRLIEITGQERLLSDRLSDAAPAWSPDSTKVAAAFETDVAIYDAVSDTPTGALLPLREPLLQASIRYDAERLAKKPADAAVPADTSAAQGNVAVVTSATPAAETNTTPLSFNLVVRLEWMTPETLYLRTAFLRLYKSGEVVRNYPRWHLLHLSPQATVISRRGRTAEAEAASLDPERDARRRRRLPTL